MHITEFNKYQTQGAKQRKSVHHQHEASRYVRNCETDHGKSKITQGPETHSIKTS